MKFIGIIPARYASTRFPGKPLAILGGKTVIQRVYEKVMESLPVAYVATDDERIYNHVKSWGGNVVMTSPNHKSGTDRIEEAIEKIGGDYDVVINIQGDEPFIAKSQIDSVCSCFNDPTTQIATLGLPFYKKAPGSVLGSSEAKAPGSVLGSSEAKAPGSVLGSSAAELSLSEAMSRISNPNSPKIVVDNNGFAMYFSRSVIPFIRGKEQQEWPEHYPFLKHIGLYAYRREVLKEITALPQSSLELAESLEQLRWLQNGYRIKVGLTDIETVGIDTPEDLAHAESLL